MRAGLTIGEFARLTHLSVRTLRRYHEAGLLEPASVDAVNGYRYYAADQIPAAQVIHRLRELDVPLAEVSRILSTDSARERAQLISGHLHRLEAELDRTRAAVSSLRQLLSPDRTVLDVQVQTVPARTVAAVSATVHLEGVLEWFASAMAAIDAATADRADVGAPGGHFANELFTEGEGVATVYRPLASPPCMGRVTPAVLPAAELATTVHVGAHDDIDVTYGRLGQWVVEHALAVAGPVQETYLVGPRDTPDAARWRTEIGWPIFRVSQE